MKKYIVTFIMIDGTVYSYGIWAICKGLARLRGWIGNTAKIVKIERAAK